MSWSTPPVFTVGQVLTASQQNIISGDLTALSGNYATTLPGSPGDNDRAILVDSTTAPTYQWAFRYNASNSGSYKWEFVGGAAVSAFDSGTTTITGNSFVSTGCPSFTFPRAGIYLVNFGMASNYDHNVGAEDDIGYAQAAIQIGGSNGRVASQQIYTGAPENTIHQSGTMAEQRTVTASQVAQMVVNSGSPGDIYTAFYNRWIEIVPLRVS